MVCVNCLTNCNRGHTMNTPIWLLVILAIVCTITGYFCGVINTRDDAKDKVLQRSPLDRRIITCFQRLCDVAGIKPYFGVSTLPGLCEAVEGLRPSAVLPNDKWKARADALYDFFVTSEAPWRTDSRGQRMDCYIEWVAKGVKSRHRAQLTQLSNALVCYTGLLPNKDIPGVFASPEHRYTEILGRHNAIQEQAKQCGYSTILYSLSPSSSIFTPSFVNGWVHSEPPRQRSCAVTSTSRGCRVLSVRPSSGLNSTASRTQPHTRCPSCPRLMPTAYKQKCIECRRALRQTL
ncbi:hypothetical phage membrane protein [Pseudomonas phage phi2]|uniref:Hypothetical phage membrane protein n=1 Tax=Pseudomonas phage phi2 TaxID=1450169 RepID=D2EBR1_9CAUD|nr:hypothetical phage membrane protein [Pseudomonas phage phi-2]CBH51577.1 hypothetical phage membrane protein [Pseudomonas phage phi-2]